MSTPFDTLDLSKKLLHHLGIAQLPKYLVDDKKREFDSTTRSDDENILAHYEEDSLFSIKTVRFLKDFYRYQAGYDLKTKNISFLRTAELFRQQGIKNYYFILQLNNPLLQGVDPYDENLTEEQKVMISHECKTNFWYFLREVCQLRPGMPFKANRGNISFIWTYLCHVTSYMIMPRQQGKLQDNDSKVRVVPPLGSSGFQAHWKRIGDLNLGDQIIDVHGQPSTVIGIHPQGEKRMYKVNTSDGRFTRAGAEHLWTVFDRQRARNGVWCDYTTSDLIKYQLQRRNRGMQLEIPLITPQQGKKVNHVLDPYFMGVLMGGELRDGALHYGKDTLVVYDQLDAVMHKNYVKTITDNGWMITPARGQRILLDNELGLPVEYLEGALEDRLAVLQGVMDVRGGIVEERFVGLTHKSKKLREGLKYIVRGLGGTASDFEDTLCVTLPEPDYFKHNAPETIPEQVNKLFITNIEFYGKRDATCIEVDNIEQLYITDDFIVTHNTVSVQVINFWLTYVVGRGYKSHLITLKSDNRAQFIDAVKRIRGCLPKYLVNSTYKDKDSGTYLTYKAFGEEQVNTLTISVPQQGEAAAGDLGRGLTVGTTTIDEGSYIGWIKAIVDGCMPSALTEMENCRNAGLPYGISYITTPNTVQHPSGQYMFDMLMSATEWREKFFDSFSESHLNHRLIKASPKETTSPMVSMVYNYLQLGKNKDWVKETIDQLNLSLSKAKIDLLLMWTEDGEDRVFDDLTREAINNAKRDPVWSKEYRDFGLFMDYFVTQEEFQKMCKPEHNDFFIIGCDTSSAINQDACTIIIRSIRSGRNIGVGRFPLAYLDDVASVIVDLLVNIHNSMLIPERNYAHHMIDSLLITLPAHGLDPFKKIYNQIYQSPVKHEKEFQEVMRRSAQHRTKDFYLKLKQYFGFNTNAKSREEFYGYIQEAVALTGYGLSYTKLADELINLRIKGGRIDHDLNKHDDLVVAWLLSYWFIKRGNSKSLYGIPQGLALTSTKNILADHADNNSPANDPQVEEAVDELRKKVGKLTEELMKTNDNILALRLEAEIRKLSRYLPVETRRLLTIDSVIEEAKLERNRRILALKRRAA